MKKYNEDVIKTFDIRANILWTCEKYYISHNEWYEHWVEYQNRQNRKALDEITRSLLNRSQLNESDNAHVDWIYHRLINVHNENPKVDYMIRLKKILDRK
jgi:hypothetical protein